MLRVVRVAAKHHARPAGDFEVANVELECEGIGFPLHVFEYEAPCEGQMEVRALHWGHCLLQAEPETMQALFDALQEVEAMQRDTGVLCKVRQALHD